jgi:hypothetical protein
VHLAPAHARPASGRAAGPSCGRAATLSDRRLASMAASRGSGEMLRSDGVCSSLRCVIASVCCAGSTASAGTHSLTGQPPPGARVSTPLRAALRRARTASTSSCSASSSGTWKERSSSSYERLAARSTIARSSARAQACLSRRSRPPQSRGPDLQRARPRAGRRACPAHAHMQQQSKELVRLGSARLGSARRARHGATTRERATDPLRHCFERRWRLLW